MAEMIYLDDHTENYKEFEENDNISIYLAEKIHKINSNVFIVPRRTETSSFTELTRIY